MFLETFNEPQTIWDVVVKSTIIPNPTILPPKSTLNDWMQHFNIHSKGFKKCEIVKARVKMIQKPIQASPGFSCLNLTGYHFE
jgi:hypothetical protein